MNSPKFRKALLWLLAAALLSGGTSYLIRGVRLPWTIDNDCDMRLRHEEYSLFAQHLYPHRRVAEAAGIAVVTKNTVYPPYAFPMFAAVFWPATFEGARALFQVFTLAALGAMMWYGARELGFAGKPAALLGASVPFAFSGNCSAVALGQFSIICAAFVVLQVALLKRNRPALAGICWALAMLKPQIGLPFAVLFLVSQQWRGLVTGGMLLALLTVLALWWTHVAPWNFWQQGVASQTLKFAAEGGGAGLWVHAFGINPRAATLAGLGMVVAFGVALLFRQIRSKFTTDTAAAMCAVLGASLFYHHHYDNMMFVPLILPLLVSCLRTGRPSLYAASALLALTVYAPPSFLVKFSAQFPETDWIVFLVPGAAAVVLWVCSAHMECVPCREVAGHPPIVDSRKKRGLG